VTRVNPNEFFQVGPLATKMLQEDLATHVGFQASDLIPVFSDEPRGFLNVMELLDVAGPRR
jgi:hypothetical protein